MVFVLFGLVTTHGTHCGTETTPRNLLTHSFHLNLCLNQLTKQHPINNIIFYFIYLFIYYFYFILFEFFSNTTTDHRLCFFCLHIFYFVWWSRRRDRVLKTQNLKKGAKYRTTTRPSMLFKLQRSCLVVL